MGLTEEQAYERFKAARFAQNGGEPFCPKCGCDAIYTYQPRWNAAQTHSRREFKCKACDKRFSATSGTPFSHRKMPFKDILWAIAIFIQFPKGTAALQIHSLLRCDYRTARLLTHKLREAMARDIAPGPFEGEAEADMTEIGGYIRPKNARKEAKLNTAGAKAAKKNPWKVPYQSKKKLIVTAIRERGPHGRIRTEISRTKPESRDFLLTQVTSNTTLYTDQESTYGAKVLWAVKKHLTVNHQECFWTGEAHTNTVENYFAMLKRGVRGVYHHIAHPDYAHSYTEEQAWRLSNKAISNQDKFERLLRAITMPGRSKHCGWWQRARARAQ
jgi:transposase-like protein